MTFEQIIASAHDALVYAEKKADGTTDIYVQLHGAYVPRGEGGYYRLTGDFCFSECQAWNEKDPISIQNAYEVTSIERCEDGAYTALLLGAEISFFVTRVDVQAISKRKYFSQGKKLKVL